MMSAPHKLVTAVLVAAACTCVPASASAGPIVLNCSFAQGTAGFDSTYGYLSYPSLQDDNWVRPPGVFTIGGDPRFVHDLWTSFGDHSGDGAMMIVNGSVFPGVTLWSAAVDVSPGTQYELSAWLASSYPLNPASLLFSINGTPLDVPFTLSTTTGVWQEFNAGWYSGSQTTANISIVDLNTEFSGNDFALDDITLEDPPPQPVPEPASSVVLLGLGLTGLVGFARRLK